MGKVTSFFSSFVAKRLKKGKSEEKNYNNWFVSWNLYGDGDCCVRYHESVFSKSQTSDFIKKQIFQFDFETGMISREIAPGDSFSVRPVIYNDATEEMYVFIRIQIPTVSEGMLYVFDINEDWTLVESSNGTVIYAYGNADMTVLSPGDSTGPLTNQMTMQTISNAEYAAIDDINITITGYALGIEDMIGDPIEVWSICKEIGNIE